MKILLLLIILLLASCSSVDFNTVDPNDETRVLTATEKSLFDEKETISLTLSKKDGGKLINLSWKGKELLSKPVEENFPNQIQGYMKENTKFIEDNSGLLMLQVTKRGFYQLSRAYSAYYDDEKDEYMIEVIYHIKNHNYKSDLDYQWQSSLNLKEKPKHFKRNGSLTEQDIQKITDIDRNSFASIDLILMDSKKINLTVKASKIENVELTTSSGSQNIELGHGKALKLSPRARVNWKVQYILKEIQ